MVKSYIHVQVSNKVPIFVVRNKLQNNKYIHNYGQEYDDELCCNVLWNIHHIWLAGFENKGNYVM